MGMTGPDLSALTPDEQVTYWIGAVARNDAFLEALMRRLLRMISSNFTMHPAPSEPERGFERVRSALKAAVKASSLFSADAGAIVLLLGDVSTVHNRRVTLVHDMWMQVEGEETFSVSHGWLLPPSRPSYPAQPVEGFQRTVDDQMGIYARLMGMEGLYMALMSNSVGGVTDDEHGRYNSWSLAWNRAVVGNQFDRKADGAIVTHDPRLRDHRSWSVD